MGTVADTVAEKPTLVAPAATVTLAGIVTFVLLLAKAVTNPPVSAAPLNVTVQAEVPAALTIAGMHERPLSVGAVGCRIESVPPVPEAEIELPPLTSVAITPVTWSGAEVTKEPDAIVNVALATVPLLMVFVLSPYATQVVEVVLLEQVTLLPAAVVLDPAVTVTLEMSEDE